MEANKRHRRRGSMYVAVLGTSMVIMAIGLGALLATRVERRFAEGTAGFAQARIYAQSAIEIGLLRIDQDPDWRTTYPNGVWEADRPIGTGTYTLEGVDPNDSDLSLGNADPVLLTGTGTQDDARYKLQVTLVAEGNKPLTCLEVSLHAGNDLKFNAPGRNDTSTIQGNQIVSANNRISQLGSGSVYVYPDMEAVNGFSGPLIPGTKSFLDPPRTMPDPITVFDFYKTNGTWISIASIGTISGVPTIAEQAIGPGYMPYGPQNPQQTNAEGIYVIDCQGQNLQIRNSRIFGTLVLLNTGSGSCVYNSVNWEPAVANYPALLVSGRMDLVYTSAPLADGGGRNYNPPGAPYMGEEDTVEDDTYPSRIKGLVYISGDSGTAIAAIPINYRENIYVTIDGVMVVGNSLIQDNAADMNLTYQRTYLDNPPPGFGSGARMSISRSTWRQIVD